MLRFRVRSACCVASSRPKCGTTSKLRIRKAIALRGMPRSPRPEIDAAESDVSRSATVDEQVGPERPRIAAADGPRRLTSPRRWSRHPVQSRPLSGHRIGRPFVPASVSSTSWPRMRKRYASHASTDAGFAGSRSRPLADQLAVSSRRAKSRRRCRPVRSR